MMETNISDVPICIIIVAYKNEAMTIEFVDKELSKVKVPHKTIIVNNGATKESNEKYRAELAAEVIIRDNVRSLEQDINASSNVYLIDNPENSGFAIGNNLGAKFAEQHFHPKYLVFTNNDIRLKDDDVIEKLIVNCEQHPDIGIIGPMVRGLKGDYQSPEPYSSFADRFIWIYLSTPFLSKEKKIRRFKLDYPEKAKEGYHYRVMGSFFMCPSKAYFDCGMMDEHTFLYAEEMILTERMAAIGKRVYYDPEVCVIHAHGATTGKTFKSKVISDIQFNSNAYYYHKYRHVSKVEIAIGRIVKNLMHIVKK